MHVARMLLESDQSNSSSRRLLEERNVMNTRETALIGLLATLSSIVLCQFLARAVGHHAQLSSAQIAHGLAIGLAGVAVGLTLVLGASLLPEAGPAWVRSLGTLGLALGGALVLALFVSHRPLHSESMPADATRAESAESTSAESTQADARHADARHAEPVSRTTQAQVGSGTVLLAPGAWR